MGVHGGYLGGGYAWQHAPWLGSPCIMGALLPSSTYRVVPPNSQVATQPFMLHHTRMLLLRQVSVDGEAEAVEVVEEVLNRLIEVVAKPKVASVFDDAREQHTLATVHVVPDVSASECLPACLPWPCHL